MAMVAARTQNCKSNLLRVWVKDVIRATGGRSIDRKIDRWIDG